MKRRESIYHVYVYTARIARRECASALDALSRLPLRPAKLITLSPLVGFGAGNEREIDYNNDNDDNNNNNNNTS